MIIWTLFSTITAGFTGLVVFLYFLRKGQFDDIEDIKYQLFRNDQE